MPASALLGAAATFAQNRTEAIHRWYPYVEGFSSGFVSRLLAEHPRARSVLDPFAGSGTTPLVASHAGLSCGYCEVNPVMRLAARAKLEAAPALASRGRAGVLEAFRRAGSLEGEIQERAKAVDLSPLSFTFEKRAFFEEAVLRDLLAAVSWIGGAARGDSALADLLRLALASIVVSCSNMKRAADLRYRRGREVHEVERSVARALSGRLACMRDDLVALAETLAEGGTLGKATLLSEDARELPLEQAGEIDLALTSPPYLNGTNYMRNSKLELLVLGFIRGESELAALHTRALTAGINGVSRRIAEPARFPEVEAVARKLDRCAYDKRIPALVRAYASDMERVLSRTATLLRPGGALLLDIGDSHFCGVNVPTDELLVALARLSGLRHVGATFLRKRSSNGGAPLKQVLLRFKKEKKKRTTEAQRTQSDRGEVSSATPPRPRRLRGANRSTAKAAREFARELPYRELPYSRRNWGHPWHSLCSYQGKLKPGLAHHLVSRFTRPGETVLDPLGGVGTIAFEACLAGRRGISNDVNPVAHACARAKLGRPDAGECFALLGRLERALAGARPRKRRLPRFNGELASYYHPTTLGEILRARAFFLGEGIAQAPRSSSEALVLASLLHVLHGNRPYALSRRSHPLTPFAPSGPFVEKALVPHVRAKVERALAACLPEGVTEGRATFGDFRDLPERMQGERADAVISSPPFVGSTRFYLANWIRLWFCGWEPDDFQESARPSAFLEVQQRRSREVYASFFEVVSRTLRPGGLAILHLGATERCDMGEELALLARERFSVLGLFRESVAHCQKHGVRDQGATREHELLFLELGRS